jgi:CubicO group peptidase (beta-lactamase class C family)
MQPTLFSPDTVERASTVAFPGLSGVLPGFGRQVNNDWGLGVEIRDTKEPHWTGSLNSPRTFGHFGQSGAFLWVDPVHTIAAASVADRPFGPWAARAWPELADAILNEAG